MTERNYIMGDRAQVRVDFGTGGHVPSIYFYTHWQGYELPSLVAEGIARAIVARRQTDEPYFTRILAGVLERAHADSPDTGYGIAPFSQDNDGYPLIVVNPLLDRVEFREDKSGAVLRTFTLAEYAEIALGQTWGTLAAWTTAKA